MNTSTPVHLKDIMPMEGSQAKKLPTVGFYLYNILEKTSDGDRGCRGLLWVEGGHGCKARDEAVLRAVKMLMF